MNLKLEPRAMIFEWMSYPAAWAGLATLIVLEIVLGIDNLMFIAILTDKIPPHQRDKARMIGLTHTPAKRPLNCMRRLRPIEFRLAGGGDVMKRRAAGSSSGTTRRGPYAPSTCWV